MTIGELLRQGFHYARTCRSLWLFGFFVALSTGGANSGGHGHHGPGALASSAQAVLGGLHPPLALIAFAICAAILLAIGFAIMRFISEGALIEGVARARAGEPVGAGQGFRAGAAHFWVLLRIALIFTVLTLPSIVLPILLVLTVWKSLGLASAIVLGVIGVVVLIPWLISLAMMRAFAARIAVLENRGARDAFAKARRFLHGRIGLGLRMIVASLVGEMALGLILAAILLPLLVLAAVGAVLLHLPAVVVLACLLAVPPVVVLVSMCGVMSSSIWTVGYLSQAAA